MNILVTGGAGAIGRYVVQDLAAHGFVPTILDLGPVPERDDGIAYVQCDLMDLNATLDVVRGYDVVVHLAAIPNPYSDPPDRVMAVNTVTTFNVLEAIRLRCPETLFINASTNKVYGKMEDLGPEGFFIIPNPQNPSLGGSCLTYHPAGTPL